MKDSASMTQANREGWDHLAEVHYKNYHIDTLRQGKPLLDELIQNEVGDVSGKSLLHFLCHIGTDTLSWALLGATVSGVDISPEALECARRLAAELGIEAEFIQSDIMNAAATLQSTYDIVFSSTGVLCWIPDIRVYAETVKKALKPGGFFYILDGHPFRSVLDADDGSQSEDTIVGNYFRTQPWRFDDFGDYTEPNLKFETVSYEWHWKLGDVVTAFCEVGMRIEFVHEFPRYFYNGYTPCWGESEEVQRFPCTFSMKASLK